MGPEISHPKEKPRDPSVCNVRFLPSGRSVRIDSGATIMDCGVLAGVWVDTPCGGEGRCGKCVVRVVGSLDGPTSAEKEHLDAAEVEQGKRLACQATITGDCSVEPLAPAGVSDAKSALSRAVPLTVDLPSLSIAGGATLGAALDVGTTTLCVSCIDLTSGERLGIASAENPQTRFSADVMTRIDRCRRDADAAAMMHKAVVTSLNELLENITISAGRSVAELARLVFVGNTTMVLLALGEDPSSLGSSPFEPAVSGPVDVDPRDIGVNAAAGAHALVPHLMSGFVGADILAAMLATGVGTSRGTRLVVDLGTNGEIALGSNAKTLACATAAGPAFEGMQISRGMRAVPGAIESFSRDGYLEPVVLGGGKARGICGSGLLDAAAALLEVGLLKSSGRLLAPEEAGDIAPGRIRDAGTMREFLLAPGTDLYLTQEDIRQFQLAKGAVRSGMEVLMTMLEIEPAGVETVNVAGVFGSFVKPTSALGVGLLPAGFEGRIEFVGNAALIGAEMMLTSERRWDEAQRLAAGSEAVELSGDATFEKRFIESLSFPAGA